MKKTLLFVLLLLMAGCAQKEELHVFSIDKPYVAALRHTQKGDISISLENKALIIATYLDPLQKREDKEYFFVRVYIDNDFDDPKRAGLFHPGYELRLDGKKPLEIKELDKDDPLVKSMPLCEPWYHFYLVTFPKTESNSLTLTFSNKDYGSVQLHFSKDI